MTEYFQYYKENLYPLQDRILDVLKKCGTPFYLTGGTALSRGYYNHRFSDDLDFFINSDNNFYSYLKDIFKAIEEAVVQLRIDTDFNSVDFSRTAISDSEFSIKVDFVNDIPIHYGDIVETPVFVQTDSVHNILTNKYTALYRLAPKDVVDIREICLHEHFSWDRIIQEADKKEAGINLSEVCDIMTSFDDKSIMGIKWINALDLKNFRSDVEQIARDMLLKRENSLI